MRLPPRRKKPSPPGSTFTPPPRQEVTPRHQIKGDQILGILKGRGIRFDALLVPEHVFTRFTDDQGPRWVLPSGITIHKSDVVHDWECAAFMLGELVAYVELEDYK